MPDLIPAYDQDLLDFHDVMRLLHVSRSTLYGLIRHKALPVVHIGRLVRFRPEDVRHYVGHHLSPETSGLRIRPRRASLRSAIRNRKT
jgi:excisionase family DNA binding protein